MHTQTKQLPVYALVLADSSHPGSQLKPHPETLPCPEIPLSPSKGPEPPPVCGLIQTWVDGGLLHLRMIDVSMETLAGSLVPFLGPMARLDERPTIDRTGLKGRYDFTLAFQPEPQTSPQSGPREETEMTGPVLVEALRKQLGLKLVKQTGPVNAYVIDHVEMPSDN